MTATPLHRNVVTVFHLPSFNVAPPVAPADIDLAHILTLALNYHRACENDKVSGRALDAFTEEWRDEYMPEAVAAQADALRTASRADADVTDRAYRMLRDACRNAAPEAESRDWEGREDDAKVRVEWRAGLSWVSVYVEGGE